MGYDPRQILLAVEHLRPGLQLWRDFDLADHGDGSGPFVSAWYRLDVTQPSVEDIASVDTDAIVRSRTAFRARDLLAQLTADDYARILQTIGGDPTLGLLWASLLAQGEALISAKSDRFEQGWAGLSQALGTDRANAIAQAIGVEV